MKLHELHESTEEKSVKNLNISVNETGFLKCRRLELTSLEGCPVLVNEFDCTNNKLTSLLGGPKVVNRNCFCSFNKLTSLEGCPLVGYNLMVDNNLLTSLNGISKSIGGSLLAPTNKLTNLKNIHKQIDSIEGYAEFHDNPITSHVLGLLLIDRLKDITLDNKEVQRIINKHLRGSRDVFECQQELMDEGFDEYAQL